MTRTAAFARTRWRFYGYLEDPDEHDARRDEGHPADAPRTDRVLLEPDPPEVVDHERCERLPGDDEGDQSRGAQLRRGDDRAGHVEGAEPAADPDPPGCVAEPRPGGQRLEDEGCDQEQSQRAHEKGDQRRPDGA